MVDSEGETLRCQHCDTEFSSDYAWEMHILAECPEAPENHKEWIMEGC